MGKWSKIDCLLSGEDKKQTQYMYSLNLPICHGFIMSSLFCDGLFAVFCLTFTWYLGTYSNVCLNFLSIVPAAVFIFTYFFISTNTFFLPWLLPAKQSHGLDATPLTNWLSHWLTSNWRDKNKNVPDQTRPWTPKLLQILNPLKSED